MVEVEFKEIDIPNPIIQTMGRILYLIFASFPIALTIGLMLSDPPESHHDSPQLMIFTLSLMLCFIITAVGATILIWSIYNKQHTGFWKYAVAFSALPFIIYPLSCIVSAIQ